MESNNESDSGTDDDLPPGLVRQRMLQAQGASACRQPIRTKRPATGIHLDRFSAAMDVDKSTSTQELEMNAYTAVLLAFSAQPTALTWTKERLMCDLRKELRISEEQHRQLTEEFEARQTKGLMGFTVPSDSGRTSNNTHIATTSLRPPSSSAFPAYRRNLKISQAAPLQVPIPQSSYESSRSQTVKPRGRQPAVGPGALIGSSTSKVPAGCSNSTPELSSSIQNNSNLRSLLPLATAGNTAAANKDLNSNREGSGSGRGKDLKNLLLCREVLPSALRAVSPVDKAPETQLGPYLGQKVQRLWPDDKVFYDAVIVDYDQESGKHALVYDMETPKESYEWVNFKDIAKGDIKIVEGPPISLLGRNLEPPPIRGRGRGRKLGSSTVGRGRGKAISYSNSKSTSASGLARVSSPIKGVNVGAAKTLRKENAATDVKGFEAVLHEGRGRGPVKVSLPDLNERELGETAAAAVNLNVPVISEILEEAKNLDEIVDLNKLADMKHKVEFVAEAFRTALDDLGDSSHEGSEDDMGVDIKCCDEANVREGKTTESEEPGVVEKSAHEESDNHDHDSPVL